MRADKKYKCWTQLFITPYENVLETVNQSLLLSQYQNLNFNLDLFIQILLAPIIILGN